MKNIKKIIFIGGNRYLEDGPLIYFANECKNMGIEIELFTDNNRINFPTETMGKFKDALKVNNIPYHVIKNINDIAKHITSNTIVFSVNCRWIIPKKIIKLVSNNIYNYHNSSLPSQRGAACHSWRLMQGKATTHLTIHRIESEIDKGDIIIQKLLKIPKKCINLKLTYKYIEEFEKAIFKSFLSLDKYPVIEQNEDKSFYWPRLDTTKHGFINWTWTAIDIKLFCSAFDYPFKGASTYLRENQVFFHDVELTDMNIYFHPFQAGLVYRIKDGSYYIATTKGGIKVKNIVLEDNKPFNIKLGDRFVTPINNLYEALTNESEY